jgi:hypothetical protein
MDNPVYNSSSTYMNNIRNEENKFQILSLVRVN